MCHQRPFPGASSCVEPKVEEEAFSHLSKAMLEKGKGWRDGLLAKNTCCMRVKTWFQTLRAYGKARWSTSSTVGGIEYHLGGLLAVSLTKMATYGLSKGPCLKAIMQSDSPFDVLLWPPHTRRVTQLHTQGYGQHSHRAENKRGGPVSNPKSQPSLGHPVWHNLKAQSPAKHPVSSGILLPSL